MSRLFRAWFRLPMLAHERRNHIAERLRTHQGAALSVSELSNSLGVSAMTIRRDLDWLDERGLAMRVHGGAFPVETQHDLPYVERAGTAVAEKLMIGQAAAALILDGDHVILDSGTTTMHLARGLERSHGVTAVTNALPVAQELSQCRNVSTIMLGGMLKQRELCTVGPPVTAELSQLSVEKAFISASGFSTDRGATDPDLREAEVKRAMMAAATESYLVIDSSKWGIRTLAQIATLDAFRGVVTDSGLPQCAVDAIEILGVRVIIPDRATVQQT